MGWTDYEEPTETVQIGTEKRPNLISVRGLAFDDICRLARALAPVAALIYKRFMDEKAIGFTPEGLSTLLTTGAAEFPEALAFVIGLATDDTTPESLAKMRHLRMSVQAEFIQKIIALTFMTDSEIKKLVEIVTEMVAKTSDVLTMLNLPDEIPTGSGNGAFVSK